MKGVKTITTRYFNGTQSTEFTGIYEIKGNKCKINIDVDSYDMQSSAKISVFNPQELKWNFLSSIPFKQMDTIKTKVYGGRPVTESGSGLRTHEKQSFEFDIEELLVNALEIL
tara:strand:- start:2910 stop:3248 length:339 start_codon:yes stop_codon:yes gene_type:complete